MKLRPIATTLTIGSFILIAVTGICLLFGFRAGLVKPAHELGSILFLLSSILHCVANRAALLCYLKKNISKVVIILFAIVTLMVLLPIYQTNVNPQKVLSRTAPRVLVALNASELGVVTHKGTSAVMALFKNEGLVADSTTSVETLSKNAGKDPFAVLLSVMK